MIEGTLSPLLLLTSPMGDDRLPVEQGTLHAIAMTAVEELSKPFEIAITAVSTARGIDPDELLNKPVTLTLRRKDGVDRVFNGIVQKVESLGSEQRLRWRYRLNVVPKLWFLAQAFDCRVFQQQTAIQILQTLFSEHRVEPTEFRVFGAKPVRPYTTQFNESDLSFAERVMQESGYFYFFEHSGTTHTLVVTDGNQAFKPQQEPVHRVILAGNNVDIFDAWSESLATAYGRVQIQDYDPLKPRRLVNGQQQTRLQTAGAADRQVYRWPAMTIDNQVAADRARFRIEAAEASASLRTGHGYDPNLCPGFRFTLAIDPVTGAADVQHAVQGATHTATDETWIGGTNPPGFACDFVCFPQSVTWRDNLTIPRPMMPGIFSGLVLGEPGEEIHSDHLARIKVQPLFDHRKDTTAAKSIFVRILHAWAGDKWGWQHLPRVGTEVGIAFMNGDPDNPVVVGCFYHEENPPIFPVPEQQTKQGFKSRSTLHGGTQDYNELSFDDRKGQEVVLLHAQRDHKVEVERDQTSEIGNDRKVTTRANDSLLSETGSISVTAALGEITVTAATTITLKVDASTIIMTPASIRISTPLLTVDAAAIQVGGGEINVSVASVTVEAADVTLATPEFIAPPPGL